MSMPPFAAPISILVAEDSPPMLSMVSAFLEQEGATVHRAADGDEAMAALDEHDVDVLVLDLHMPGRNGLAVLAALHERERRPATIVFSASADDDHRHAADALGADAFVPKPGLPFLRRAIDDVLERRSQG
jgi:two-component system response regulator AdeR